MTEQNTEHKDYNVNLPRTDFPMRAGLPQQEPKWIARWHEEDIYRKSLEKNAPNGRYLLHCGPPYANGALHMGHALSYVLKDFVVRSKAMAGYNTPFIPGWDCHGLPIEWKVEQGLRKEGKDKKDLTTRQLRDLCRTEAQGWIDLQRESWRRYGVLADLDHPYITMDKKNEAGIVRALGSLVGKGAVYRGVKSVNWSTVENTALAEAEIEYAEHTSKAIYVAFPVVENGAQSDSQNGSQSDSQSNPQSADDFVVIWTTTPWTMPANKAVAYHPEVDYVPVTINEHPKHPPYINEHYLAKKYWLAADLVEDFASTLGLQDYSTGKPQKGSAFENVTLKHPFYNRTSVMLPGEHVTTEGGTGFVHTAPAHGAEDFELGKAFDLDLSCPVSGDGLYEPFVDDDVPEEGLKLAGKDIWAAQEDILAHMRQKGVLLKAYKYKHSYPISWRSKAPLIFRTTPQWFLELDKSGIRETALREIDNIESRNGWIPGSGYKRIRGMIEGRPDWCLSRQRSWGVPITIFTDKTTQEPLLDEKAFEVVADKIEQHGIDAWEEMTPAELLHGYDYAGDVNNLEKETDILDVWFDSGTTWLHVLAQRDELKGGSGADPDTPADLYLEGSDQHRGWFHTSLLTGCSAMGRAPYRSVLTHGYVVDGDGRKMSKSVGNVVSPDELTEKFGMDIVRLWVAASDYREDVRLSDKIIKSTTDSYRRLRNTFRYLLGNLHDFDPQRDTVPHADLPELEKWVLSRLHAELEHARTAYENFQYHRAFQGLHNFCATELSNLYFDIRKDALYCDMPTGHRRRACQTVLMALLKGLTTHLAPVLVFTSEEVWRTAFGENTESVHLQTFFAGEDQWRQPALEEKWQAVWDLRHSINKAIEPLREEGVVKTNANTSVFAKIPQALYKVIGEVDMAELLMAAEAHLEAWDDDLDVDVQVSSYEKCPRCWRHTPDVGAVEAHPELCQRCAEAEEKTAEAAA